MTLEHFCKEKRHTFFACALALYEHSDEGHKRQGKLTNIYFLD